MTEFGHRYQRGECRKHGQHLGRRIFKGCPTINKAQRQPYLTIGKPVFLPEFGRMEGGDHNTGHPVPVEIQEQGACTPPVVVIDGEP